MPRSASAISLPLATAGALLVLILYAAFEHGAVALPADTRIEIAIAVIAAIAGAGWLLTGTLRPAASRGAIAGLALFAGFACWSGITLVWSVAPNQTWIELNRAISYVLVLCLAAAVGASYARAITVMATGFGAIAMAVTVYALGQKLLPGLRIAGVISLDQTGPLPRLQEPLGYWNALALFIALGVPIVLAVAIDRARRCGHRLAAVCAIELMLLAIGLTYSRGGLIAVAAGLSVAIWAGGGGLRAWVWIGTAVLATIPPLAFGLTSHALTAANVPLASREDAGVLLAVILLASLGGLVAGGRLLLAADPRIEIGPRRLLTVRRLALAGGSVLILSSGLPSLASSKASARRLTSALGYLRQAVGREPTDEQAWDQLAVAYFLIGDRRDARTAARRVVTLDPYGGLARTIRRSGLLAPQRATL